MNRRRFVLGTLAVTGGSSLLIGSSAFSTGRAERDLTIDVVGDDEAVLQLRYGDVDLTDVGASPPHEETTIVELGNLFESDIEIAEFEVNVDGPLSASDLEYPDSLDIGETAPVTVAVNCAAPEGASATVLFDVAVTGEGVAARTTKSRAIEVTCGAAEPVTFAGSGNIHIPEWVDGSGGVDYWTAAEIEEGNDAPGAGTGNGNGRPPGEITAFDRGTVDDFDPGVPLQAQTDGGTSGFVAVYIPAIDASYHHPGFDPSTGEIDSWDGGDGLYVPGDIELEEP
ncbi:hypothetical protein OB905_09235 [Halobacteria archaeon AArc-dxtr1]|nr:hypothetical protein [Halobacteria archaeon AArc-dxtr1]